MKHIKKIILVMAVMVIVATGVTMAMLSDVTETKVNAFSSDRSLSVMLREPTWDGYTFDDKLTSDQAGQVANPDYNGTATLGIKDAQNYYPSQIIAKNPMLKNNSDKESEIVAIKVEYVLIENGKETKLSKSDFNKKYAKSISSNDVNGDGVNDAFVNVSDSNQFDIYMYGSVSNPTVLNCNDVTKQLFDSIQVNQNIEAKDGKMPNFQIKVTGFAIQSNVDGNTAIVQFNELTK